MEDTDVVLWKGNVTKALVGRTEANSPMIQSRFFLPSQVLVSRYGVVGMLVADSKPEHRKCSYTEGDWYMDYHPKSEWDLKDDRGIDYDPVRRAHFVGTEQGFSLIRAFGLPQQVADVFARNRFLGEPFIEQCACDVAFEVEFDEMPSHINWSPVKDAMPLIQTVAMAGWEAAGLPHDTVKEWQQFRTWLSFHGWFAFAQAAEQGQLALAKAIQNFDSLLDQLGPQKRFGAQPYPASIAQASVNLPEKA